MTGERIADVARGLFEVSATIEPRPQIQTWDKLGPALQALWIGYVKEHVSGGSPPLSGTEHVALVALVRIARL